MSTDLHYHYVYFNNGTPGVRPENDYNAVCLRDAALTEGVDVIPYPMAGRPGWLRRLYNAHISPRRNARFLLPFKGIWYPLLYRNAAADGKPLCFIGGSTALPVDFFRYLKKKYPGSKAVKVHRDLLKITYMNPDYTEERMNAVFDLRCSYDEGEAKEHGFLYFDEIESKIDVPLDENYPLCDVFFAGKAKDRMPKILKAYEILTAAGLKCDFYITHCPVSERVERPGITYSDCFMPYYEMLRRSVNARCMLDINQTGAVGYTSRFLEAVIYNKPLIADNPFIRTSRYYDPRFIQLVDRMDDVDPAFVKRDVPVDYHYAGEFSPVRLLEKIDAALLQQEGR